MKHFPVHRKPLVLLVFFNLCAKTCRFARNNVIMSCHKSLQDKFKLLHVDSIMSQSFVKIGIHNIDEMPVKFVRPSFVCVSVQK